MGSRERRCLVFLSGNPWDWVPSRQHYLMKALSKYIPVVWLDNSGSKRAQFKTHCPQPNITVVQGVLPFWIAMKLRGLEGVALPVVKTYLKRLLKDYDHVLFWSMENWLLPHRGVPYDRYIFDCIDPIFSDDAAEIEAYAKREVEILQRADKVFATAETLAARCREYHQDVTLLNNACAPEEYTEELVCTAPRPDWWPETARPVAAYLGSIDWRFDFDMADRACRDHPDLHFVLAGNIVGSLAAKAARLAALQNVTVPGIISVSDGRYLLSRCTIGLIPFTLGTMNDAINPVKMYAYALMGKPIAGSAVNELRIRPDIAATGSTPELFSAAVSQAIDRAKDGRSPAHLTRFALDNTWEVRAEAAWQVLDCL